MNANLSKGIFWVLLAVFFYSCGHGAVATISPEIPVVQIQFLQYLSASVFLLFFLGKKSLQKPTNIKLYLFRCLMGVGAAFTFMAAYRQLNLFNATLLNMTSPFYMPVIGALWLKEKYSPLIWPVLALGFCGTALIFPPSKEMFQTGAIFALASGLLSAIALSSLRALSQKNEPAAKVVFFYMAFGTIFTGCICFFHAQPLKVTDCMLGIFGGLCLGINQMCLFRAFQLATTSSLAPFAYFSFPFSAMIDWFIFDKPIQFQVLLGAILIGCCGILTHRIYLLRQPFLKKD